MNKLSKFLKQELKVEDESIFRKFGLYNNFLLDWNSKINLISRNSESIEAQTLNSIFFLTKYKISGNSYIADIGTGGGFPGIPLKILDSSLKILLVDSIYKKVNVLGDMVKKLEMKDVEAKCGRAETISKELPYIKKFDIVTAKSVATLDKLFDWTKNLLKENGKMIFIKGGDITEELKSLKKKNRNIETEVIEYNFNDTYDIEDKKIVIIKKHFNQL